MKDKVFTALNSTRVVASTLFAATLCIGLVDAKVNGTDVSGATTTLPVIKLPASIGAKPEFVIRVRKDQYSGLELSATLSADSGKITKPINWTIFAKSSHEANAWKKVEHLISNAPNLALEPGTYVVQAKYGLVRTARRLDVRANAITELSVNLNAGGLRVMSHLNGKPAHDAHAEHTVYHLNREGTKKTPIGSMKQQGSVLRVPAGTYKIISRFHPGNAEMSTIARVKPGHLSAVEIDHAAAFARFTAENSKAAKSLDWVITDRDGSVIATTTEQHPSMILKAGTYTVTATVDGVGRQKAFSLKAGDKVNITLHD